MRILEIAIKDLLQVIRDRKSLLFLALMPVAFTLLMGFAFSRSEENPNLPVGWLDRDAGGALSAQLREMVAATAGIDLVVLQDDEARIDAQVAGEELVAAVIIPQGFSSRAMAGDSLPLAMIVPHAMAGQTATTAIQAAAKRVLGAVEAAHLSVEAVTARHRFADPLIRQSVLEANVARAVAAWQKPSLTVRMEPATDTHAARGETPGGFQQSSPGMIVMFAIFSLNTSAAVLVQERKAGTLRRMLMAPMHRMEPMTGHLLAMFAVVFLQSLLLVALGQLAFGIDYLRQPLGTLLLLVALGLWVTSLGLLIGALARSEEQVVMFSLITTLVSAALGGAMFPLEIAGAAFSHMGGVLPTAWAMEGLQNIVVRGQDLRSTLLPVCVLLVYAAAVFALAVWQFSFE